MIPQETYQRLDFARICNILADNCATAGGKKRAKTLAPCPSKDVIGRRFAETEEALLFTESLPFGMCAPADELLHELEAEPHLRPQGFLRFNQVLQGVGLIKRRLKAQKPEHSRLVRGFADMMCTFPDLEARIETTIDEEGVKESASPRLAEIRRQIAAERNQMLHSLDKLIKARTEIFQESGIHFREGRLVLAVRRDRETDIDGVVHGMSSGGATVFVEPFDTVAGNNRLRKLRSEESEEIERILRSLADAVREKLTDIRATLEVVEELDFIFARAEWAVRFKASSIGTAELGLEFMDARHPMLSLKREVVPLDMRFDPRTRVLLISGPNAGGKTVVLKTVGLLSILAACGLHVPASPDSRIPLFKRIFIDVGDEQSLDDDLSSFTAHLANLRKVIEEADEYSLILLDELGSSTSPEEGGALGMAVLEALAGKGATVIATTHLESLKYFVEEHEGMQNAGMEFDGRPTYRLIMGIPGASNALEVAEEVGFPAPVIDKARSYLRPELLESASLISKLSVEHGKAKDLRVGLENRLEQARMAQKRYEELERELISRRKELTLEMVTERKKILDQARKDIENLVREIREGQAQRKIIKKAKEFLAAEAEKLEAEDFVDSREEIPRIKVSEGMKVHVEKLKRDGKVLEIIERSNEAMVEIGTLRMAVSLNELTPLHDESGRKRLKIVDREEVDFNTRLQLRGLYADEAYQRLLDYVMEALALGINEITVVHGKGTGVLRNMVMDFARNDRHVASFRVGEPHEGGDGVTVLRLAS
ncbi:endonuclease MutS2 [candidate division WOR-3 bacterium]|nr:endonuclease MutS2 [candidate division WOR-3 bacterium]